MTGSRRTNQDSQNGSDSSEEDDDKSPVRGRTGKDGGLIVPETQKGGLSESNERKVDAQIAALLDENSKASGA